jgi:hypothetical protein
MLPRPTRELAIAALILVLSATNGAAFRKLPAHGTVAGKSISTTVDSPLAKYYLENSLSPSGANSELDKRITDVEQRAGPIDWVTSERFLVRLHPISQPFSLLNAAWQSIPIFKRLTSEN